MQNKRIFYYILGNTFLAAVTNAFIWFALTFWVFLETRSVLATSWIAGIFAVMNMVGAAFFGSIVDHNRKKTAMLCSSIASLVAYCAGAAIYFLVPGIDFSDYLSPMLWVMIVIIMVGAVAGNLRYIALATTVTMLFPQDERAKANGLVGVVNGMSFGVTSVLSGLGVGFLGFDAVILITITATAVALVHLLTVPLKEPEIVHLDESGQAKEKTMDLKGTIAIVSGVSGLFALILFTTFNNFLGGVFMALMDAYGLTLVSVETWGLVLGVASFAFIAGSSYIAKFGLGKNPVRAIMIVNIITWSTCIFYVIQPSIILMAIGMFIWMALFPIVEAAEHTVIQRVVPFERQGRVFGFAQSIESAASPITTFLIGPIAQFIFIPFMTTGAGVALIGSWFGTGPGRGIALVFIAAGIIGLVATLIAFNSGAYKRLTRAYLEAPDPLPQPEEGKA
jgi:MFS transporter, DHA3 family, multidrug efflux protein